ncbi:ECF transporter S component [Paenibacillus athensensis]|uniref:ECF transporter S component n=1 Tax=Paenibacillus athensensis TaxID=1967502 RepID=A0A4Y8Q845_9BACL|nr:ECF transporter S component [Paenibacillus athensensis]MCD1259874.1 ECF transporter S component [Paenibacillus athensensis]
MSRHRIAFVAAVALFLVGMGLISTVFDEQYMLISFALVIVALLPFFIRFELRSIQARELVLLALLAAIAAISRVPFAPLPSVQPTSFVIIASALAFGAESGFLIGAVAALVSNMFLGQGPWTPWQMFAWGMIGWSAGLLNVRGRLASHRWALLLFGFGWGLLFGWIMNFWSVTGLLALHDWSAVAAIYAASFYFDLAHALSNVFFLALFARPWLHILARFKRKYGLLSTGASRPG